MKAIIINCTLLFFLGNAAFGQIISFRPGEIWNDTEGNVINAHGGGILYHEGVYYWFGEKRGRFKSEGVNVYSSLLPERHTCNG